MFNQGFGEKLSHTEQLVHLVALVLTTLSIALVMTPAALHRMAEPRAVSERFLWLASNMILAGMFPLALAVGLDAYVVASVVIHSWLFLPRRETRKYG